MLNIYRILLILSGILTCYYGAILIEQIRFIPSEFTTALIAFVIFIGLFNVENGKKQNIIKIKYADLYENLNDLLNRLKTRFDDYSANNDLDEIALLKQETRHYISIIALIINTHQRPFAVDVLLNGTENDQSRVNRQLIDIQNNYLLIEEEIANYLYERKRM